MILDVRAARFAQTRARARRGTDLGSGLATDIDINIPQRQGVKTKSSQVASSLTRRAFPVASVLASAGFAPPSTPLRASRQPTAPEQGCGCACCLLPVPQCPAGWAGTSSTSRRSGADLSASGRGGESRSPCPRHYGVERAPSQSLGIHFDSRTYWFEPGVRADGRLFLWSWWAVDSAGGTKPAKPSGPGFLRGALPGRVLFPCWCGRSGGAPASASGRR